MRKGLITLTAATILMLCGALTAHRAEAMPLAAPIGVRGAAETADAAEQVRYVCRMVWRCGPYGCGWRRVCWWRPGPYYRYYYRPYRYYPYY
ncbi:MAG TPA: hypothetical protein VNL39_07650 [Xanthobacteraceae bacterium]|nr:hypothetical protein [Xanthobacteraceae bacterium]